MKNANNTPYAFASLLTWVRVLEKGTDRPKHSANAKLRVISVVCVCPPFPAPTHLPTDGIPSVNWGPLGAQSELSVAAYSAMSVLEDTFRFSRTGFVKRSQTPC